MRVLAIDPGYDRVGIALLERTKGKEVLLHSQCFITKRHAAFEERLLSIGQEIERVLDIYKPDMLALEKLYFNTNQKTAMGVSEVRGMLLYIGAKAQMQILELTPLQVKQGVTGNGRSNKAQVIAMVERLLRLRKHKRLDDEYDAIALALTALTSATYHDHMKP